jgi:hypothetical protein
MEKCYYITRDRVNRKRQEGRRIVKSTMLVDVIKEGVWDGEKFTHVDRNGCKTIIRNKEWLVTLKPLN